MKINFESEFLDYILSRGYEYYLNDTVSNVKIDEDNTISATVIGNNSYEVNLEIEDNIFLDGDCTCPYYKSNGYCKHMAAVLYYLNEHKILKSNNNYDLQNIVNKIPKKDLRRFLYNSLRYDSNLLNKFRIEFNNYFPKLSKKNYQNKIQNAILSCYNRQGYITYDNTSSYTYAMHVFIREAEKLVDDKDYETAFTICTILLDSIPNTSIDDSDGSTGEVAESVIAIIFDIIEKLDYDNAILKNILDYVTNEAKTEYLYNYGIDLKPILEWFIDNELYLNDIKSSLLAALDNSKDKKYFYKREHYVKYLIQINELQGNKNEKIKILEKYSYDHNVFLRYIEELIKNKNSNLAIKLLNERLDEKNYNSRVYANTLADIYLKNKMMDEYTDILYKIFYKYDKYSLDDYRKIKKLYSTKDWDLERNKILENIKNDKDYYYSDSLNKIYIEEKMYDELFLNVCNYKMNYIKEYEKYLLPKYQKEILDIYKRSCLNDAKLANSRSRYREVASEVNYIMHIDNSDEIVKSILKEIKEEYFRNRPAMLDEFEKTIKNLYEYL